MSISKGSLFGAAPTVYISCKWTPNQSVGQGGSISLSKTDKYSLAYAMLSSMLACVLEDSGRSQRTIVLVIHTRLLVLGRSFCTNYSNDASGPLRRL